MKTVEALVESSCGLIDGAVDAGRAMRWVQPLLASLETVTGVCARESIGPVLGTNLDTGVALSPLQAARCATDLLRTQVFLQAVDQAIGDRRRAGRPVDLLYAGTGPYGLLLLPVLAARPGYQVRARLVDVHPENVAAVERVVEVLAMDDRILSIDCADATCWRPPGTERYDLILSETMNRLLANEPQVAVFAHLSRFLRGAQASLIPERIRLSARLHGFPPKAGHSRPVDEFLGEFACLDRETAVAFRDGRTDVLDARLPLPTTLVDARLELSTEIQVYAEHRLAERDCSLTLPQTVPLGDVQAGGAVTLRYRVGRGQRTGYEISAPVPARRYRDPIAERNGGRLRIPHLERLWDRARLDRAGLLNPDHRSAEWDRDLLLLASLGLGLEPCVQFLYHEAPSLSEFEDWIVEQNGGTLDLNAVRRAMLPDPGPVSSPPPPELPGALDSLALERWHANGYLVLEGVLTPTECRDSVDRIYELLDKDPTDLATWYRRHPAQQNIMAQLFRDPVLDRNRQAPRLREVFETLWRTDRLQAVVDRVGFLPPESPDYEFDGTPLHWDLDFKAPLRFAIQGLLYLTDVVEDQGAFRCVPGFHRRLADWLARLPAGADPNQQDLSALACRYIAAPAGSLIVWHAFLPHGASPNRGAVPRITQYVNMLPTVR